MQAFELCADNKRDGPFNLLPAAVHLHDWNRISDFVGQDHRAVFFFCFFFNFAWIHLKSAWEKRKQQDFYLYKFFFLCMVGFNMYFWMLEWTVLLTVTFKKGFWENAAISSTESCSCSMQCSPRFLAPWPISDSLSHIQENLCSLGIFLWLTLDQISKFFVISCYTLLYI